MANGLKLLLALVVGAHGIGHVLFLVPLLGVADWGQSTRSWLLGEGWPARGVGSLLWLAAIVGFVAVVVGFWSGAAWWRPLAVAAAAVSTVGLILFWTNPLASPAVSALVFNLLVLAALLVFHWPPLPQPGA